MNSLNKKERLQVKPVFYPKETARCQAVSAKTKKRCKYDATHQIKGQALCARHANMTLEKKK